MPDMTPVFSLTTDGRYSGHPDRVGLETHATVVSLESEPLERIHVVYNVDFKQQGEFIGSRSDDAMYTRRGTRFVFDARSKSAKADIENLYDIDMGHPSNNDYLRYLLPKLQEIAAGPENDRKAWLKRFLKECCNTRERRALEAALAGKKE
jgi:hypothetical protein